MATFDVTGLEELIDEMARLGEDTGEAADEMLMAGADETAACWKEAAQAHGHRDTGEMIRKAGHGKPRTVGGIRQVDVYPRGKDQKGVRNAEKAFITHYGKRGQPGSHWVDDAQDEAEKRVPAVMESIWNKHIGG